MKELSSPIYVRDRHWGPFRMGFSAVLSHQVSKLAPCCAVSPRPDWMAPAAPDAFDEM